MKKILMMAAATVAVMSSCSKNDVNVESANPANAISFGTYVGAATKAEVETAFEDGDVFLVDAYYAAKGASDVEPFMQDQAVYAVASADVVDSWTYSPVKYWPNNDGDKVSFYAVTNASTYAGIDNFNDLTDGKVSFTVENANSDIMISSVLGATKPTDDAKVAFTFQHTMAQVNFTAKLAEALVDDTAEGDETVVYVKSLTVNYGTAKLGGATFTFDAATANTGAWALATDGDARKADEWTKVIALTDSIAKTIGEPIMILPVAAASYEVTFVYTVATTDKNNTANNSTITNTCTFNIEPTTMNTIYNYNLAVGLKQVEVTGSFSADWGATESNKVVTVASSTGEVADAKN